MMTGGAAMLFLVMLVTALLSLGRDLIRPLADTSDDALIRAARAEAARIAALPRGRQPLRVIAGEGVPQRPVAAHLPLVQVSRLSAPALAAAA